MNTKKNVLEKLSDHELEQYIKPESRFVPQAILYAYEILQSRGRNSLITSKSISTPSFPRLENKKQKEYILIIQRHPT